MKRRARSLVTEITQETPVNIGETAAEPTAKMSSHAAGVSPRLSIPLTSDGFFDLATMQGKTKEKLLKALTDPALGSSLGDVPKVTSNDQFPPEICGVLYDSLSALMIAIARRAGYAGDEAARALIFTGDEKAALSGRTSKVLNKHLSGAFGKYQDEIMLATLIGTMVSGKVSQLRKPASVHEFPNTKTTGEVKGDS